MLFLLLCASADCGASSSSSSSPSPSDSSSDGDAPGPNPPAEPPVVEVDETLPGDRFDPVLRSVGDSDQRKVYMWTWSHTELEGRRAPQDTSRSDFAGMVTQAYQATGKTISQWSVFKEIHPLSKSRLEQKEHFHMVVETDCATRWKEVAAHLRQQNRVYASASTSSSRRSYWNAFAYLYTPNGKKSKEDVDPERVLSPGHEEPPEKLEIRRQGLRRLQPAEVFRAISEHCLGLSCYSVEYIVVF